MQGRLSRSLLHRPTHEQACTCSLCPQHTDAMHTPLLTLTHLGSQVVACGQVLETVETIPVSRSASAGVVVDHLGTCKGEVEKRDQDGKGSPDPGKPVGIKVPRSSLAPGWDRPSIL